MCCCDKPNVNGEPGAYSWDGKTFMTRPPNQPTLAEGDVLIYDLPGRCGGMDSHCHGLRMVKDYGNYALLVRHGGGEQRHDLGRDKLMVSALESMDDNARYWFLIRFHHVTDKAVRDAVERANGYWEKAVLEKRVKVSKRRGHAPRVRVVEPGELAV